MAVAPKTNYYVEPVETMQKHLLSLSCATRSSDPTLSGHHPRCVPTRGYNTANTQSYPSIEMSGLVRGGTAESDEKLQLVAVLAEL